MHKGIEMDRGPSSITGVLTASSWDRQPEPTLEDVYESYIDAYLDVDCTLKTTDFPSGKDKEYHITDYHQFEKILATLYNRVSRAVIGISDSNKKWLDQVHEFVKRLKDNDKLASASLIGESSVKK